MTNTLAIRRNTFLAGPLAIALAVATLFLSQGCSCNKKNLTPGARLYSDGLENLLTGDTLAAQKLFAEAEKTDPESPWVKFGRARQSELFSEPLSAAWQYYAIIDLHPEFDSGFVALCRVLLNYGKDLPTEKALERYRLMLQKERGAEGVSQGNAAVEQALILSRLYRARGEIALAQKTIQPALEKSDDPRLKIELAHILLAQNKTELAYQTAKEAAEEDDEDRDLQLALLHFYLDANDAAQAVEHIGFLAKEFPTDFGVTRTRIEALITLGYLESARVAIVAAQRDGVPEGVRLYLLGQIYEAKQEYRRARTQYELAFEQNPLDMEFYRLFARFGTYGANPTSIDDDISTVLFYAEKIPIPAYFLADIALTHAELALQVGETQTAYEQVKIADSVAQLTPRYLSLRAATFAMSGAVDSTLDAIARLENGVAPSQQSLNALGTIYARIGRDSAASVAFEKALARNPNNLTALRGMALLANGRGDSAGYRAALENMIALNPHLMNLRRDLMSYNLAHGNKPAAMTVLDQMIAERPADLRLYEAGAKFAASDGDLAAARAYLTRARDANPQLPQAHFLLARFEYEQGYKESAATALKETLGLDSLYSPAVLYRGIMLENDGKIDSALAVYHFVADTLDPFYGETFNRLAWLMASHGMNIDRAADYARNAIALSDGSSSDMYTTLGWCYNKAGRFDMANTEFMRSLMISPRDAFTNYIAGVNADLWKRPDLARDYLTKSLALGLADVHRGDAETLLKKLAPPKS